MANVSSSNGLEKYPKLRFKGFSEPWEHVKLSDFVSRVTRKNSDNQTDIPLTISSKDGLINQNEFFSKQVASKDMSGYYLLQKGEFAYNKSYSVGFDFGSIKRLEKYYQGALSTLYICFALERFDSDFIKHYFDSLKWYREIYMISAEGARNHGLLNVPTEDFFATLHTLPMDTAEQRRIAEFLDLLTSKIEKQQALVDNLKKYKRGLLNRYFPLNSGNSNLIPLLGLIKEIMDGDWIESKDQSPRGIRLIQTGNVGVGEYIEKPESAKYISEETFERLHCTEIYSGDILVSRLPSPAGRACIVPNTNERMITAVDCTIIRCDETRCISEYLTQFLNSPSYFKTVESFLAGGTRQRISRKNLESILVPMVEMEEQKQIADILTQFDKKILHEISYLQGLQQCKKGLLQALFV